MFHPGLIIPPLLLPIRIILHHRCIQARLERIPPHVVQLISHVCNVFNRCIRKLTPCGHHLLAIHLGQWLMGALVRGLVGVLVGVLVSAWKQEAATHAHTFPHACVFCVYAAQTPCTHLVCVPYPTPHPPPPRTLRDTSPPTALVVPVNALACDLYSSVSVNDNLTSFTYTSHLASRWYLLLRNGRGAQAGRASVSGRPGK